MWLGPAGSVHTWSAPASARSADTHLVPVLYTMPRGVAASQLDRPYTPAENTGEGRANEEGCGKAGSMQSGGISKEASVTAEV